MKATESARPVSIYSPLILACVGATWLIWGSTYLAIRFALHGFAPFFLMATRFLSGGAALLVWQLAHRKPLPTLIEWRNGAVIGVLLMGGGMGATAYAEQTVASGVVVAFIAITPLLLVLMNLGFGIRPKRTELIAIVIGLIGVFMLTRGASFQSSFVGLCSVALGCTCWSLGSVLSVRAVPPAPGVSGFMSEMLTGGAFLLLLSLLARESWTLEAPTDAWIAWSYLVVFGSLVAFSAYMLLLARTPMSVASSYTYINPIVALVLGVLIGGEIVTSWEWLSALVVISAVVLLFTAKMRRFSGRAASGSGADAAQTAPPD